MKKTVTLHQVAIYRHAIAAFYGLLLYYFTIGVSHCFRATIIHTKCQTRYMILFFLTSSADLFFTENYICYHQDNALDVLFYTSFATFPES